MLERTDDLAQHLGGDVGVAGGGVELLVSEQDLDEADVDLVLEQVGGEGMALIPISE